MAEAPRHALPGISCKEFDPDSMPLDRWIHLMETHFRLYQITEEGAKLDLCHLLCGAKAADTMCEATL